ncbi:PREDICTED: uncharacterized protein LOC108365298 isoform X1 [Rhagoletis zephyria]|uniref:uncharacterized protein LOC108365298 isoform X1 n=2 Tax=Rhagoletis TaxID=28609 RepID=UPI0008119EFA|nr:PREDICTED: uncharacterized protein LOC108365298 isoform X1 [Rhagoletis zephyria]
MPKSNFTYGYLFHHSRTYILHLAKVTAYISRYKFPWITYAIIYETEMALPDGLANSMKKFQAHNDLPVFLKGGPVDKVLFGLTVGLCGIGLAGIVQMIYALGFKKKSA